MAYGSNAAMVTHWDARGYSTEGISASMQTQLRTKASLYIDGLGYRENDAGTRSSMFSGTPTAAGQENQWPRDDAVDIYGNALTDGAVPAAVERATYEAAYQESVSPGSLNAVFRPDQIVKRRKTDVLEREFFEPSGGKTGQPTTRPMIPAVMDQLATLLTGGGTNTYGLTGIVA